MKRFRDACGGFIVVDKNTRVFSELRWALLLVRMKGGRPVACWSSRLGGKGCRGRD